MDILAKKKNSVHVSVLNETGLSLLDTWMTPQDGDTFCWVFFVCLFGVFVLWMKLSPFMKLQKCNQRLKVLSGEWVKCQFGVNYLSCI